MEAKNPKYVKALVRGPPPNCVWKQIVVSCKLLQKEQLLRNQTSDVFIDRTTTLSLWTSGCIDFK